jgi:hypothetical protein
VGVSYALDIVRIQPFFEAAVGVLSLQTQVGKETRVGCKPGSRWGWALTICSTGAFRSGWRFAITAS